MVVLKTRELKTTSGLVMKIEFLIQEPLLLEKSVGIQVLLLGLGLQLRRDKQGQKKGKGRRSKEGKWALMKQSKIQEMI